MKIFLKEKNLSANNIFVSDKNIINSNSCRSNRLSWRRVSAFFIFFVSFLVVVFILMSNYWWQVFISPPSNFPISVPQVITPGTSIIDITKQFKNAGLVRSELLFYIILLTNYEPQDIKASTYIFTSPLSVYAVAMALTEGNYNYDLVRFTHLEGMSVRAMASKINEVLPHISTTDFIEYALPYEGELFPDTYLIPPDMALAELVTLLRATYQTNTDQLFSSPKKNFLKNWEVVILASILEREANSPESMAEIANILLRRLADDMPLQVDATMEYVLDKPLSQLQPEDLKQDSPYNTYRQVGLPPTPIGNPGLRALSAAYNATTTTPYLFYITGNDGNFYYARNFTEHKKNIARYLR